jgi:alpha-ketoglutarate-dependent taurine dioxygenase
MESVDRLYQTVLETGWAVFPRIAIEPNNAALLALGRLFGATSWQGSYRGSPNLENDGVNRVESMDQPLRDAVGNEALSSNAAEFPLHTDDAYSPAPARFVLMHCWQADASGGGESWIAHVNQIVALAPPDLIERLTTQPYTTPYGQTCILMRDTSGQWHVRFNHRDMLGYAKLRFQFVSEQKRQDLAAFAALAMQCVERITLKPGDCIVVDNHRVLHGRSNFDPKSGRLIKRLRIVESKAQAA